MVETRTTVKTRPDSVVKARDAASVILHRLVNSRMQVLLGRRNSKSSFMPNVYVFPGGAVESADARIKPATDLDHSLTPLLAVAGQHARARTLANAAVRETYEECGIMISRAGQTGKVQQETWQEFQQLGQAPDLASLKYIGRAITPTSSKIRFHARFFSCNVDTLAKESLGTEVHNPAISNADAMTGDEQGDSELQDVRWVDVEAIKDLPMRDITRFMLQEHIVLGKKKDDEQIGNAVYVHRDGKLQIVRQSI